MSVLTASSHSTRRWLTAVTAALLIVSLPALAGAGEDKDVEVIIHKTSTAGTGGPWLGVMLSSKVENGQRIEGEGAQIIEVFEGSPAEAAGLEAGDLVIQIDNTRTIELEDLLEVIRGHEAGDRITVVVLRDGDEKTFDVVLGEKKDDVHGLKGTGSWVGTLEGLEGLKGLQELAPSLSALFAGGLPDVYVGITMENITPELREFFGAPREEGFLISGVSKDSPAEEAGLRVGDVVIAANGQTVADPADLTGILSEMDAGETLDLSLIRDRGRTSVNVVLAERPEGFGRRVISIGPHGNVDPYVHALPPRFLALRETEEQLAERIQELEREISRLQEKLDRLSERLEED
jgi:membrane-associated protease RseP (regulator of RpoE activity)